MCSSVICSQRKSVVDDHTLESGTNRAAKGGGIGLPLKNGIGMSPSTVVTWICSPLQQCRWE